MKKVWLFLALTLVILLTGCSESTSSDTVQKQQQEIMLQEATRQTGMPDIANFHERKMAKTILEMRDKPDLTTYAYTKNLNGKFTYLGRSVGFGLPYATQYTNPQKVAASYSQGGFAILPQADPNGLFSPGSAEATWVVLVNEATNEPEIIYVEERLVITQTKFPKRLIEEWSLPANY